jgi:hypothetical protein
MKFNWRAAGVKQGPKGDGSRRAGGMLRGTLLAVCLMLCGAGLARSATLPPGTTSVPLDMQDLVEASLSPQMVLPQTARWNFEFMAPYMTGGNVVCGTVNYQSAMRIYLGPQRFYAIIKHGVVTIALLQDPPFVDTTGAEAARFRVLCDRK